MSASTLSELLSAAEAALDRDDAPAAVQAVEAAARACAALGESGAHLEASLLPRLLEQHARLQSRAVQARDAVTVLLQAAGRSRRARTAYRQR